MGQRIKTLEEEAVIELREVLRNYSDDPEVAHIQADGVLIDFLTRIECRELVKAFNAIPRWYA